MLPSIYSFARQGVANLCHALLHYLITPVTRLQIAALLCLCSLHLPVLAQPSTPHGVQGAVLNAQLKSIALDTHSEFWIDTEGNTTVEQLHANTNIASLFAPRQPAQNHNVHGKALWIKFDATITDPSARWYLEIPMATLDEVTLYWRDSTGTFKQLRAGDTVPRAQWPQADRFATFRLNESAQPATYYLRIRHDRVPFSAPLSIHRDSELVEQREREHFALGAYFSLIVLIACCCLAMASTMRDNTFIKYFFYVLTIGGYQAAYTGIGAQYLWPSFTRWADKANFVLPALATIAGLAFVRTLAKPSVFMPRLDKAVIALLVAQSVNLFLELVYPTWLGFQLLGWLTIGIVSCVYAVVWFGWTRGDRSMRWTAIAFLPVVVGVLPQLMRNAGWINSNFFTQYGVTIGSALEMPILLYALVLRANARREGIARAAGLPTQDALTGLANMRELLRNIHGAMTRAVRFSQQYGLVQIELTNYAWFVKEHGREMGDKALVLLSTRLQLIARDVDTCGRLNENSFALLVEGPCTASRAAKVAAQIAACGHRPTELLPVGATLKLQVTCALMPDLQAMELGDDANAQLGWLIHRSEMLDDEPRKVIRTLNF
jgi:two-component system, sensor histidine kinase LadS